MLMNQIGGRVLLLLLDVWLFVCGDGVGGVMGWFEGWRV